MEKRRTVKSFWNCPGWLPQWGVFSCLSADAFYQSVNGMKQQPWACPMSGHLELLLVLPCFILWNLPKHSENYLKLVIYVIGLSKNRTKQNSLLLHTVWFRALCKPGHSLIYSSICWVPALCQEFVQLLGWPKQSLCSLCLVKAPLGLLGQYLTKQDKDITSCNHRW